MMTDDGIDALIEFTDKTGAIIVTRAMTDQEMAGLEKLLLAWKENPGKKTEQAIIKKYAVELDNDKFY